MASKKPEIQADALLNLVLDESTLKQQLSQALGTSVREAAKTAQLGNELVSPQNLQQIRRRLARTFQDAGKELGEALNVAQSDSLKGVLDKTRRDTVKKFQRDIDDLMSGKGRPGTRTLPALPQLGKELRDELRSALRVFGQDSLRSGSYQQRTGQILDAQRNVAEINKVLKELAGLPAVAARDLQQIRNLVNDKDTGRYLRMQKQERENLAKSSQALQLQTQNLNRLATTLSRMGFGDAAAEIKAANQARKDLVSQFTRLTSPAAVEARASDEARTQARIDRQLEQQRRRALRNEIRQREAEQKAQGTYQTVLGPRRAGQVGPGLAATMDDATRARLGYKPREDMRQATLAGLAPGAEQRRLNAWFNQQRAASPLEQAQQNIARAAAQRQVKMADKAADDLSRYNDQIRQQGDRMLALRAASIDQQNKELSSQQRAYRQAEENQQRARAAYGARTASYGDAQRVLQLAGGFGGLRDDLDIGIVRGGLGSAYRQAQTRAGVASSVHGVESAQYREALADLNRIRGERDALAQRIRAVRAERAMGGGAGGGGGGRGRDEYSAAGNLLGTFSRYAIGYGGLYQVLNLVTQLKTEIIELDRAFYSIKAVTQATDIEMNAIARSIREVALNTNFTTREIAAATEVLGQAGVLPQDMDKVLSSTARFASATNSSLQVAADLMTTVRTVFKEVEESTIADQLTKAINLSKLTAEDLKTILSLTAQTASSYNLDLEQLLAATTTLRNAGVKPSTVATGLRQAMLEIFNPDTATMKALAKRYAEMGEQITGAQIQQRFFGFTNAQNPLIAALTELRRIGFTDEGQKTLQRGVDIRAFNAIQGLLQNFKELEEAESRITFGQAAAEGSEIQMRSLAASLENLGASVVVLAEQLSNGLVRQLANGAKEATNLIERLTELDLEMRSTGAGSLGDVISGAFAGGVAGAMSGGGFRKRLVGGLAGATAGGYLAGGYKFDEEGGFGYGDAAAAAATLVLLGRFIRWIGAFTKAAGPAAAAAEAAGGGAMAAGAAKGLGARLVPILGWVLTAVTVLESISNLIPEDQAVRLAAQAQAAQAQAAKLAQRLGSNTELVNAFNPDAESPEPGTAGAGFAKYRESLENFQLTMGDTFGDLADGASQEITDLLKTYSGTSFSRRGEIRSRIEAALGRPLGEEITDKVLFDLGQQREAIEATVNAYVDNTRQTIQAVTERIRAARQAGEEITAKDAAMSQAFSENADELLRIMEGSSGLRPEEIQERLRAFYARFVEIVDERPALYAEQQRKQMTALSEQLAAALQASDNSTEIASAISQIGNSLEYVGLTAEQKLASVQAGINKGIAEIDKQILEVQNRGPGIMATLASMFSGGRSAQSPEARARAAANQEELLRLQGNRQFLLNRQAQEQANFEERKRAQEQANLEARNNSATNAANLISGFNQDPRIAAALGNENSLRDVGLDAKQIQYLRENRDQILGAGTDLLGRLGSTRTDEQGNVISSAEYQRLDKIFNLLASNLDRVTQAQERAARDEKNLVSTDLLRARIEAQTETKRAEYNKNFGLLASESPDNPVVKEFAAQRQILEKELAQARAKADDAKEDGAKGEVGRQQAVLEAQAKLDTLDLSLKQELEKYAAKLRTAGEQAQRKADNEAKKQAKIAVTQTGIEQRIVKQNFDEAIRTGDTEAFLRLSNEYVEVQARLRDQLEEELKARGYTTSQILDEIKLREDLNKPLAEQVDNIRKLANQQLKMLDLQYRDIGSGPMLGDRYNTAYLGMDGFTTEEQIAAGMRDLDQLLGKRAAVQKMASNALFQGDDETVERLNKELDDLNTKLGETQATLDRMTRHPADGIYAAFSPRNLMIELENSQYTFENLGDNLRGTLGSAIDSIGDGLARAINEGEKFSDVLRQIINQAATQALGDLFKTNLREGLGGLVAGASGKDGGQGGFGGVLGAMGRGLSNFFGFGGSGKQAPGTTEGAEQAATGVSGFLSKLFGTGGGSAVPGAGTTSVSTMMVQAGTVTVNGAAGGMPGATQPPAGFNPAAAANNQGTITSGTPQGVGQAAGSAGGSWMGALGGGLMGAGLGSAVGGAVGGKKGKQWGAILGALAGAYFGYGGMGMGMGMGFGMAGGGSISKSGLVMGSGPRGVDSVPVQVAGTRRPGLLAPGEGILNVKAMDALGTDFLDAANNGKLFLKAVGGVVDESYNATQRAQASARNSVAMTAGGGGKSDVTVNLKNVNITDKSEVFAAMQTREGEDLMINRLKARGALNS